MDWRTILEYYYRHRGAIIGGIIGLILAIAFLIFGFFKVLFIALFVIIGYYVGKRLSEDKNYLTNIFVNLKNRIFPPGMYK